MENIIVIKIDANIVVLKIMCEMEKINKKYSTSHRVKRILCFTQSPRRNIKQCIINNYHALYLKGLS